MLLSLVCSPPPALAAAATPGEPATSRRRPRPPQDAGKVAGIRTVFLPSPANPLVAVRLFFQVGAVDDPQGQGRAGRADRRDARRGRQQGAHLRRAARRALPAGGADPRLRRQGVGGLRGHRPPRQPARSSPICWRTQILTPRFADDDFTRNRQDALDYVTKTLRGNADEDLGKQAMATVLYKGHPYGHPIAGDGRGAGRHHARRRPQASTRRTSRAIAWSSASPAATPRASPRRSRSASRPCPPRRRRCRKLPPRAGRQGATRCSSSRRTRAPTPSRSGAPLDVTRKDADFYPLTVARSYLGEHRTFNGVLMNHLREKRGLNYGDYAYVENFIQDGWSTFPLPNIPRRQQHFEIWLRPVPPHNSLFALRAALYETDKLIRDGIPAGRLRGDAHLPGELLQPVGAGRRRAGWASPSTPWSPARTWSRSCRRGCRR